MMRTARILAACALVVGCFGFASAPAEAQTSSALTFRGQLANEPDLTAADFRFTLFDAQTGGNAVGKPIVQRGLAISNGSFTTEINFGTPADGSRTLYVQVDVRKPGTNFSPLNPRQKMGVCESQTLTASSEPILPPNSFLMFVPGRSWQPLQQKLILDIDGNEPSNSGMLFDSMRSAPATTARPAGTSQPSARQAFAPGRTGTTAPLAPDIAMFATPNATAPAFTVGTPLGSLAALGLNTSPRDAQTAAAIPNYFNGKVLLDAGGEAWVQLPEYFETVSKDPTYHLTPIGKPAPMLHVALREKSGRFKIAGGSPNMEVSWVVMGSRNDVWTPKNPSTIGSSQAQEQVLLPALFTPTGTGTQASAAQHSRRTKGPQIADAAPSSETN